MFKFFKKHKSESQQAIISDSPPVPPRSSSLLHSLKEISRSEQDLIDYQNNVMSMLNSAPPVPLRTSSLKY